MAMKKSFAYGELDWYWQGDDLHYTLRAVSFVGFTRDADCGNIFTGDRCSVEMSLNNPDYITGYVLIWREMLSLRGNQSFYTIVSQFKERKLPKSGVIKNYNGKDCILVYARGGGHDVSMIAKSYEGTMTPPPPPTTACSLGSSVQIEHGTLDSASAPLSLSCTGAATVRVYVKAGDGSSSLALGSSGIRSRLTVNGADGAAGYQQSVSGNQNYTLSVGSQLSGTTGSAGRFSGSAVVTLNII